MVFRAFLALSLRTQAEVQLGLLHFGPPEEKPEPDLDLARHISYQPASQLAPGLFQVAPRVRVCARLLDGARSVAEHWIFPIASGTAGGAMQSTTTDRVFLRTASIEDRVKAVESVLQDHGLDAATGVKQLDHLATEEWVPQNGARVVARAWTDPAFRERLLKDGRAAVAELGLPMPAHHRHLVVLENTATVHNVICCSLCSCTAFTLIGLPPDWYKDFEYRSRVVRESRTVLREMGLELPPGMEIRVWDTTADTRYMVLPVRPAATEGWPVERLADIVTQDSMIGVSRLDPIGGTGD